MIKVDNKRALSSLTRNGFNANKKRNLVMVLAIILTTFMLTTVFSIGVSYITSYNERNIQMEGIDYDAVVMGSNEELAERASKVDSIKVAGQYAGTGMIVKYGGVPMEVSLRWCDEICWKKMIPPATEYIKGTYPQKRNEIMLSKKALDDMEIQNPQIGMTIETGYSTQMTEGAITWVLTGYYKDYTGKATGYVSKTFQDEAETGTNLNLLFENPLIDDEYIDQLSKDLQLNDTQFIMADTEIINQFILFSVGMVGIAFLIVISGFLLIYNVMYISISKDVRFYGLLKTVGITSKQINLMLKKQIYGLALIGIPSGLILGATISLLVVPSIVDAVSIYGGAVSFNPIIFIGAGIFSLITIMLSTSKPVKIAKNISPVEATRFTTIKQRKTSKHGVGGAKISRMALSNVFRDKKRVAIVFLSLIVGLSTFTISSAVIKSNGADNFLNTSLDYDLQINNKSMAYIYDNEDPKQIIPDGLIKQINSLSGVNNTYKVTGTIINLSYQESLSKLFKTMYEEMMGGETYEQGRERIEESPEDFYCFLVGIDEKMFDEYNETLDNPIDKERFLNGETALISSVPSSIQEHMYEAAKNSIGKDVTFYLADDKKHDPKSVEIADVTIDQRLNVQYAGFWDNIIVSENLINEITETSITDHLDIVYEKPYDEKTEAEIMSLISGEKLLKTESKIRRYKDMKSTENQLTIFGSGIALILAFLGIMNYVNMITTDIQNRKNELAILQGIGMTSKQQRKMLIFEGLFYALISIVIAFIVGIIGGYFLFKALNIYEVGYIVPIINNLIFFLIILAICVVTPPIVYRLMTKSSIVDQLRDIE